jgi:hypothetical protein
VRYDSFAARSREVDEQHPAGKPVLRVRGPGRLQSELGLADAGKAGRSRILLRRGIRRVQQVDATVARIDYSLRHA